VHCDADGAAQVRVLAGFILWCSREIHLITDPYCNSHSAFVHPNPRRVNTTSRDVGTTWQNASSKIAWLAFSNMFTKGIYDRVSIDTPDRYVINIPISTLDHQSVDSRPSGDRLICINQNLVDWQSTFEKDVIECRSSVNQGVTGVLIEYLSRVDQGYQSRVSINSQLRIPLAHIWS